jgi:WD40 repeat protein
MKDNRVYSVSQDGTLKVYDMREERQLRSTQIGDLALSSCCLHKNDTAVMLGSWDNNMYPSPPPPYLWILMIVNNNFYYL